MHLSSTLRFRNIILSSAVFVTAGITLMSFAMKLPPAPSYTDAGTATAAFSYYELVGEYVATNGSTAIQAAMLRDGTFLTARYRGGLPGDGWDRSPIESTLMDAPALEAELKSYTKVQRKSPTLGKPAPADAILKYPDDVEPVEDGLLKPGGKTLTDLSSFHLHLEFMQPFRPGRNPSSQDRGNSGIYIFNNYEVQVLDTFALDLNEANNPIKTESGANRWCGALYLQKAPDLNMCYPPLRWQTYDIDFTAPVFDAEKKIRNARITVRHNGVLIHDDVELKTGTGSGAKRKQLAAGPIFFQKHGSPVVFRNVWAAPLK